MVHWVFTNQRALGEPEHTVVHSTEQPGSARCELIVLSTTQVDAESQSEKG